MALAASKMWRGVMAIGAAYGGGVSKMAPRSNSWRHGEEYRRGGNGVSSAAGGIIGDQYRKQQKAKKSGNKA